MDIVDDVGARSTPKCFLVKRELLPLLRSLPPGSMLPPERVLASQFRTSRTTVRQALQELVVEGWLSREQGRGTFVARRKIAQPLRVGSFTDYIKAAGLQPQSTFLDFAVIPAPEQVASELRLERAADVIHIERLRLASGDPMALESTYLSAQRFPGLREALREHGSLYSALRAEYGVELVDARQAIETAQADARQAALLATDLGSPLLLLTQCSRDADGQPVEYVHSLYRGDRYKFLLEIRRSPDGP